MRSNRNGFTLIESVVATGILAAMILLFVSGRRAELNLTQRAMRYRVAVNELNNLAQHIRSNPKATLTEEDLAKTLSADAKERLPNLKLSVSRKQLDKPKCEQLGLHITYLDGVSQPMQATLFVHRLPDSNPSRGNP